MVAFRIVDSSAQQPLRVPIIIELRGKSPRNMTPEDLLATWAKDFGIDPRSVMKLIVAGRIFLILEGFDEMALVGDSEARLNHFRTLWRFAYPKAKLMITGRPNFFLDDSELRADLRISRPTAAGPYCEAFYLDPFDLPRIREALRACPERARNEIVALARSNTGFHEIVSRGSLLYMVGILWEREHLWKYADRITSATVIGHFVQHSYRRQSLKGQDGRMFMVLNEAERGYFMCGVAAAMAASGWPNQISRVDLERIVRRLYDAIPDRISIQDGAVAEPTRPLKERLKDADDPVGDVLNDVHSCGLLVIDESKSGHVKFAHKSFMEYLVAVVAADTAMAENQQASGAIKAASDLTLPEALSMATVMEFVVDIVLDRVRSRTGTTRFARSSFERLMISPQPNQHLARWRANLAVRLAAGQTFAGRFRNRSLPPKHPWITALLSTLPRPYLHMMFVVELYPVLVTLMFFEFWFLSTHSPQRMGSLLVFAALAAFSMTLFFVIAREAPVANFRLWLACIARSEAQSIELRQAVGPIWARILMEELSKQPRT
jgi:hypothetical protein